MVHEKGLQLLVAVQSTICETKCITHDDLKLIDWSAVGMCEYTRTCRYTIPVPAGMGRAHIFSGMGIVIWVRA